MGLGVLFIMAACLCWGVIFAIPKVLIDFSPIEIALGRYLFYGTFSLAVVLIAKRYLFSKVYLSLWVRSLWFSFLSTVLSYTCVVFCIHYADASVTALIFGMSPITISLFGNWYQKEFSYRGLFIPLSLVALGVILVNISAFHIHASSLPLYLLGVCGGFIGLGSWTWFTIANFHFLRKNPSMSPNDWVLMMGVATLAISATAFGFFAWYSPEASKYLVWSPEIRTFLIGSFLLGTVGSWLAYYFWNLGNLRLPISLSGQLSICEMFFGLTFVYCLEKRWPIWMEVVGVASMAFGVLIALKTFKKTSAEIPLKEGD